MLHSMSELQNPAQTALPTDGGADAVRAPQPTRVVIGIPTTGRPTILPDTVRAIARQSRLPDLLILSVAGPDDLGDLDIPKLPFLVEVITGPKGATLQRNRMMRILGREDVLLLLDDDFLMEPDYVANTLTVFRENPNVVIATGTVLADGIRGLATTTAKARGFWPNTRRRRKPRRFRRNTRATAATWRYGRASRWTRRCYSTRRCRFTVGSRTSTSHAALPHMATW